MCSVLIPKFASEFGQDYQVKYSSDQPSIHITTTWRLSSRIVGGPCLTWISVFACHPINFCLPELCTIYVELNEMICGLGYGWKSFLDHPKLYICQQGILLKKSGQGTAWFKAFFFFVCHPANWQHPRCVCCLFLWIRSWIWTGIIGQNPFWIIPKHSSPPPSISGRSLGRSLLDLMLSFQVPAFHPPLNICMLILGWDYGENLLWVPTNYTSPWLVDLLNNSGQDSAWFWAWFLHSSKVTESSPGFCAM